MSEHTPLTKRPTMLVEVVFVREYADMVKAKGQVLTAIALSSGKVWSVQEVPALAARMSTATADGGLRERVEALADELEAAEIADLRDHHAADVRALLDATTAPTADTEAQAEAHNLAADLDRCEDRLWRLAAKAGWRPGNPADNNATAEAYIADALDAATADDEERDFNSVKQCGICARFGHTSDEHTAAPIEYERDHELPAGGHAPDGNSADVGSEREVAAAPSAGLIVEHVGGCNDGCRGDSHLLLGEPTEGQGGEQ